MIKYFCDWCEKELNSDNELSFVRNKRNYKIIIETERGYYCPYTLSKTVCMDCVKEAIA